MRVATDRKVSPGRLRPQSWMAWATLLISLCATLLGWRFVVAYDRSLTESRFEARVGEAHATLNAYLVAHAQALRGAQAYVGASGQPSAGNWLRLYETMRIGENYPGFNGIAYLQAFTGEQREKTLSFLRLSHPDFTIRPPGERDFHVVVSTYEPSTPLNRKAIGADSWSNDERRRTLEAARDSGETRITGKVTLVMDKAEEKRPGFLMYQAVYIDGMLPTTVEARRQNLMGFVVAPFRIGALTDELFNAQHSDIALRIVDPLAPDDDPFFHITHGVLDYSLATHRQTRPLSIGGRTWNIEYASLPTFESSDGPAQPARLLVGGLLLSLLLFAIVWSLSSTRTRAIRLAQRMTDTLRDNETKLRALLEQAPLAIWTVSSDGSILEFNDKLPEFVGSTREKVTGFNMLTDARDNVLSEPIRRAIAGETVVMESPYRATTGERNSIYQFHFQPVKIAGEFAFVLAFAEDISMRKMAEAHVEHMAHHDALTGLANRQLLKDRLNHVIANARRYQTAPALLFIDLDHFKTINDSLGHSVGDALLVEVATRLRACVRESDTLARIGGDEFVILLSTTNESRNCSQVADKVIAATAQPISIDQHRFNITTSVGIAVWPDDGEDAETLTRNADVAMYYAKNQGRNNCQFFAPAMNARVLEVIEVEAALRNALVCNEFLLHFQPQIDFDSGRIIGAEALIRWQRPERGLVPPGTFIPIAEERGLIGKLGEWVLREACRQIREWQLAGIPLVPVAINISALQLKQGDLRDSIRNALSDFSLSAEYLVLEITESAVMDDVEQAIAVLRELRDMGIAIEIDDFGTGYSSLSYLKRLPIHRLKIDQSFVRDIPSDQDDAAIIAAILSMASSLKLDVIAEGVETADQATFLRAQGCRSMQGYHFARPQPAASFASILAQQATGA